MKKILHGFSFIALFSVFAISFAHAEFDGDLLSRPHRIFEIGVDSDVAYANSSFALNDLLTKKLVVDFKKISDSVPKNGFTFSLCEEEKVFVNLNLSSHFRFSLFNSVETNATVNISKDLFDFLGDGLDIGGSETTDLKGCAESFYNIGASFQTIVRDFGVKFTPTYYVPLFYIPKTTATGSIETTSRGLIKAHAEADVDIYTAIDMHDFMENGKHASDLEISAGKLLSNGGFDFAFEIERNWLHGLNAGAYTRIPLVPGILKHKMSTRYWADFYTENLLDSYIGDSEKPDPKHGHDDFVYTEDNFKVYRPLKLGLNATYMPFGDWFKIQPALGFAIRDPYSSDATFYPEYALDLRFAFVKQIFNFDLGTAYKSQIFQHSFGFALNFRVLEIVTKASWCGTNFVSSFKRTGYGAMVGVRIGW